MIYLSKRGGWCQFGPYVDPPLGHWRRWISSSWKIHVIRVVFQDQTGVHVHVYHLSISKYLKKQSNQLLYYFSKQFFFQKALQFWRVISLTVESLVIGLKVFFLFWKVIFSQHFYSEQSFEFVCLVYVPPKHGIIKGIFSDSYIFLWHESEDINKKSLLPKFQFIPILHTEMHDFCGLANSTKTVSVSKLSKKHGSIKHHDKNQTTVQRVPINIVHGEINDFLKSRSD